MVDTEWFDTFMENSLVADVFSIDGHDASYDYIFDEDIDTEFVERSDIDDIEYRAFNIEFDSHIATGLIAKDCETGEIVGFYHDFQSWVAESRRGRGIGSEMIVVYAEFFEADAWRRVREQEDIGIGFSPAGYAAHMKAKEIFFERNYSPSKIL